jgi:phage repressor protein C with HTH and peptisase S24 domain
VSVAYLFGNADEKEAQTLDLNQLNIMHVPLVNKYAYAGYLNGFGDDEYIDELPKIPFANDVENKGEYLCFEVKGDSMDDGSYESYLEGDVLLCRNIRPDLWLNKLHIDKWDFVIVHKEHGVLVKRITDHKVEQGIITLHSLNEYYDDFDVHLKDVQKLFNIVDFRRKRNRR